MIDGFKNPNVKSFTTFFEEKNAPKDDDYNMVILHILEDDFLSTNLTTFQNDHHLV